MPQYSLQAIPNSLAEVGVTVTITNDFTGVEVAPETVVTPPVTPPVTPAAPIAVAPAFTG